MLKIPATFLKRKHNCREFKIIVHIQLSSESPTISQPLRITGERPGRFPASHGCGPIINSALKKNLKAFYVKKNPLGFCFLFVEKKPPRWNMNQKSCFS